MVFGMGVAPFAILALGQSRSLPARLGPELDAWLAFAVGCVVLSSTGYNQVGFSRVSALCRLRPCTGGPGLGVSLPTL